MLIINDGDREEKRILPKFAMFRKEVSGVFQNRINEGMFNTDQKPSPRRRRKVPELF